MLRLGLGAVALFFVFSSHLRADTLSESKAVLRSLSGCFLVDYSYSETESLKKGYQVDHRVYDATRKNNVMEWIYPAFDEGNDLRLQHVLFASDPQGALIEGTLIKHQAEDWQYQPSFWYEFLAPRSWRVSPVQTNGLWRRAVTNLDDGLRHQCVAPWNLDRKYPDWECQSYAPIPGRETRDMGRADYQTMERTSRLVVYENSWLERQDNVKTIHTEALRAPLARETGKNWYIRLEDAACEPAKQFVDEREGFWQLLRETWTEVLDGKSDFNEIKGAPRFLKIWELEEKVSPLDLNDKTAVAAAKSEILRIIAEYRDAQ